MAATATAPTPAAPPAAPAGDNFPAVRPAHTNATLYVGDLGPDVTEVQLAEHFRSAGNVLSVRVCRDAQTKRSLGYAYVNYQNPADAERVLATVNQPPADDDAKNYSLLGAGNRVIRIMPCIRDPSQRKNGKGNVFIKGLHTDIDNLMLRQTFSIFGKILSAKVAHGADGESKGYGFVHFDEEEAAKAAVAKVNGMMINDSEVAVEMWKAPAERNVSFQNVYIKHFDRDLPEETVKAVFTGAGEVESFKWMTDDEGKSLGFAFCSYKTPEEAANARDLLHEKEHEICAPGKTLYVDRAQKANERARLREIRKSQLRLERSRFTNFYVKHLDEDVTSEQLMETFKQYCDKGDIVSATVMTTGGPNPTSKGFGFVCFRSHDDAMKAREELSGKVCELSVKGGKPLYMNVAQRRDQRRRQLEFHFTSPGSYGGGGGGGGRGRGGGGRGMGNFGGNPMMGGFPNMNMNYGMGNYGMAGMGQMPGMGGGWNQGFAPRGMGQAPRGMGMMPGGGRGMGMPQPGMNPMGRGGMMGNPMGNPGMMMGGGMAPPNMMGGRGGFPQGGAPQGGMPQGGMPQGGMPQGGMPQGGMPQGGMPQARPQPTPVAPGQGPIDPASLAAMSKDQQKNFLGEKLYHRIAERQPQLAAKITGMLLEMEMSEVVGLLNNQNGLNGKVDEAVSVLRAHSVPGSA